MHKIIIADSNRQNAELIKQCLDGQGYQILVSESGMNIIAKSQLFIPDLILLGTNLNDMSGHDICKMIKEDTILSDTLILMINDYETRNLRIRAIEAGADDFIEKNFDAQVLIAKVKSLLRVKTLSDQLREKYAELEEKNKIIEGQLEMGKKIQTSLIQEFDLQFNTLRATSKYLPAIAIGGDYYEVLPLDDAQMLIILGDVSGHGISSALLTTMLKIMIKNLIPYFTTPDVLLEELNRQFIDVFDDTLASMYSCTFAAVVDTEKQRITFANAGHPAPIYIDSQYNKATELLLPGTPIGLMPDSKYETRSMLYSNGDIMFLYTDGLSDMFFKNDPDQFFQTSSEILLSFDENNSSQEIIQILLDTFYNAKSTPAQKLETDDVTIILCRL